MSDEIGESFDPIAHFAEEVVARLAPLGIDAERISVSYQDYLQDVEIVIADEGLTHDQIVAIGKAVDPFWIMTFSDPNNHALCSKYQRTPFEAGQRAQAALMPSLPRFDPKLGDLASFARTIEVYCGVTPGSVLQVLDSKTVTLRPTIVSKDRSRVVQIAGLALLDTDVRLVVFGGGAIGV